MALREKMVALERQSHMAIWRRTSKPNHPKAARQAILAYLDETTKPDYGEKDRGRASDPQAWMKAGVDYLTKEEQGKLKVYGFLRDDITKLTGCFPIHLTNNERVQASCDAWMHRLEKKQIKRTAHKYVLSLDPKLCEVLSELNFSADEMLTHVGRTVMRRYQEKHYPNDRIGYLMGIHHDKKHLHAHIMLFPTTERGKLLLVTDERRGRKPFTEMRKTALKLVRDFYYQEIKEPERASSRKTDRIYQPKLLAYAAEHRAKDRLDPGLDDESRRQWIHEERKRMSKLPERELRQELEEIYTASDKRYEVMARIYKRDPEAAEKTFEVVDQSAKELNAKLSGLFQEMRVLKEERLQLSNTRRALYMDLNNWTHFRYGGSGRVSGGFTPRDEEVEKWLVTHMAQPDALGGRIRDWVTERRGREEAKSLPMEFLAGQGSGAEVLQSQRFLERDPMMRKSIRLLNPKLADKGMELMERYWRGVSMSLAPQNDFVRDLLRNQLAEQREEQRQLQERRDKLQERIRHVRTLLDSRQVDIALVRGARTGSTPSFLEQYRGWVALNIPIPVEAAKALPEERGKKDRDTYAEQRGLNERIQASLARLREQSMGTEIFTVEGHFHRPQIQVDEPEIHTNSAFVAEIYDAQAHDDALRKLLRLREGTLDRSEANNARDPKEHSSERIRKGHERSDPSMLVSR